MTYSQQIKNDWRYFPEDQSTQGAIRNLQRVDKTSMNYYSGEPEPSTNYSISVSLSETGLSPAFEFISTKVTASYYSCRLMDFLNFAFRANDEKLFIELLNIIEKEDITSEELVSVIRMTLNIGLLKQAQKLIKNKNHYFINNFEFEKISRILSPSKVIDTELPADQNAFADINWLKAHSEEYHGQWVALKSGTLVATARSYKELLLKIGKPIDQKVLITSVF